MPSLSKVYLVWPTGAKMKFLPPIEWCRTLQLAVYGILVALSLLTYMVLPPEGTIWYMITGSLTISFILQLVIIIAAAGTGFWGVLCKGCSPYTCQQSFVYTCNLKIRCF
ncbi:MAG: hypothetical protein CM15mP8_3740 [Methanobacteriota archaeon]|nr:MAG: hypothetical protein CM15mP8_3740 [Euryarchaeota archaeon]